MDVSEPKNLDYDVIHLKDILGHFMKFNINIHPEALLALEEINLNDSDLDKFIQKLSFNPEINNHVTLDAIKTEFDFYFSANISDLNSIYDFPDFLPLLNQKGYGLDKDLCDCKTPTQDSSLDDQTAPNLDNSMIPNQSESNEITENALVKNDKITNEFDGSQPNVNMENSSGILISSTSRKINIDEDLKKELDLLNKEPGNSPPSNENNTGKTSVKPVIPQRIVLKPKKVKIDEDGEIIEEEEEEGLVNEEAAELSELLINPDETNPEKNDELIRLREEKRKQWDALQIIEGSISFHPLASDYESEFKIVKDPTGKLFTGGKIDEFLAVQVDKYNQLKQILLKRPEANQITDIRSILQNTVSRNVKFIGMVVEKRQTSNKNYIIKFEDPTGTVTGLVRPNDQRADLYSLMERLLPDHVVIVDGFYNVDAAKKSHIVLIADIIFPDTKKSHTPTFPEEDLALALISDTHFGSKDWVEKVWHRFVDLLNCRIGNDKQIEQAGKIKYLCISGDLVDGIGIYPNQENRLSILDIYEQYDAVSKYFAEIPDYITIVVSPGDHDAVRKALPGPAIPKEFAPKLYDMGVKMVGTPAYVSLHGIITLLFHGTSLIDMNMSIPGLKNEDPPGTMKELIRARHLVPTYGRKTELAPAETDWLVIDPVPDIFHTGHLHKNGFGWYNEILMVNSGCFQFQTDYMKSFGITPDIGKPTFVNIKGPKLRPYVIDLMD